MVDFLIDYGEWKQDPLIITADLSRLSKEAREDFDKALENFKTSGIWDVSTFTINGEQ